MSSPVVSPLPQGVPTSPSFPPSSRYYAIEVTTLVTKDGRTITYLKRRFLPQPENFQVLQEYIVRDGDRLDNITAQFLNDPEQFWRICDANNAMEPEELTDNPGDTILIALPEGVPVIAPQS
ncbi:MAG: LysM domain-containing protein [Bryobacteraceae bacterium]|jgi:hypothetical protein